MPRYPSRSARAGRTPGRLLAVLALVLALAGCGTSKPIGPPPSATPVKPGPALTVTALGDSVTAGTGCECTPFPQLYANLLGDVRGVDVQVHNEGLAGRTAADLLQELQTSPGLRRTVAEANVELVTIGANDFNDVAERVEKGTCGGPVHTACANKDLADLTTTMPRVLNRVKALRHGLPTAILVSGYWNVFEDGQVADQDYTKTGIAASAALTQQVNRVIARASRTTGVTYVDLSLPFGGPASKGDVTNLLAADGDHPDAAGHRLIAAVFLAAGLKGLIRPS